MSDTKRLVFISYGGSIDGKIASLLSDFLGGLFTYKAAVYCTASEDNRIGAPYGEDFSASYMKNISEAPIFIPLLSENYLQSTTTLVEMGAAYALEKSFIPFLVSGCDYSKLQPLYNIRNSDMYSIDDHQKFRKAIEKIGFILNRPCPMSDEKIKKFILDVKQLKTGYKTNLSKNKQIKFICRELFENPEQYESFVSELGKNNILDICITKYKSDRKIQECRLYFKDTKSVSDLMSFLDEKGSPEIYEFAEIEG